MTAEPDSLAGNAGECRDPDAPRGLWFHGRPRGARQSLGAFVWLAFILFPAINAFARHGTALDHALTVAAAAAFVVIYVALVLLWRQRYADPVLRSLFVGLVALACALTLSDGASWGFLFTYCAASAGLISSRFGFAGVVACSVLAGVTSSLGGANGGQAVGWVASSAGIGMLILVMRDLRVRNEQLSAARAELAQMAVARERERFARDLHDLLGHSLSVIALKAELAGRMLGSRPDDDPVAEAALRDRAATEVHELEQVARTALSEVRDAVSGYRQPTLEGELAGARMALSAAGVAADIQHTRVPLDPAVEAVLAWAVREGATNVIRHSGARHCTMRITASLTDAGVEVIDDGDAERARANGEGERGRANGDAARGRANGGELNGRSRGGDAGIRLGVGGHGIAGLAERARLLNGTIEAGALAEGGYRLAVTVPVSHA